MTAKPMLETAVEGEIMRQPHEHAPIPMSVSDESTASGADGPCGRPSMAKTGSDCLGHTLPDVREPNRREEFDSSADPLQRKRTKANTAARRLDDVRLAYDDMPFAKSARSLRGPFLRRTQAVTRSDQA